MSPAAVAPPMPSCSGGGSVRATGLFSGRRSLAGGSSGFWKRTFGGAVVEASPCGREFCEGLGRGV
jgi:hypothetical protein